ncbi:MAG: hypothetical protein U0105_12125 [Candidatus Obscuribacterales bacterium]
MSPKKSIKAAVTWFEALNEQSLWTSAAMRNNWLAEVTGRSIAPSQAALAKFDDSLRQIRLHAGAMHFGDADNVDWLNHDLGNCRAGLYATTDSSRLPRFRVEAHSNNDDEILESLRLTLIMQFAAFVGDVMQNGEQPSRIERCEGLYRDDDLPSVARFPKDVETKWRREIDVLDGSGESADDVLRCGDFFLKSPKARFCSDKCRFTTFQIVKQLQEPDYLANKQKRYRDRNK